MPDHAGRTYEFVTKAKLKPVKNQLDTIIKKLQEKMKKYGVTFDIKLVGSAGKHLVTKIVNGNQGFDFDYNLVVQKDGGLEDMELKKTFITELENVIANTQYSNVSEGTRSMTIKVVDKENSKIKHSCDFAVVHEYHDGLEDFNQEILVWDRYENRYLWNEQPSAINYIDKLSNLKANNLWQDLKIEYLKLKNNNQDKEKKSFSLFFEAINNVYNRYDWY